MDQVNPESEVVNIVSAIADNERAKAIDAIQDLLYAKASDCTVFLQADSCQHLL